MIAVNEIYGPTFQGEGKTAGKEVLFIRLAGCNLACIWCDTPFTWNWLGSKFNHADKYDITQEVHLMPVEAVLAKVQSLQTKAIVISGGEPMLQQYRFLPLIEQLKQLGYWIEIETNGTIVPAERLLELIDQINCSPKLASSGKDNSASKRLNDAALRILTASDKVNFKFVVKTQKDIVAICGLVKAYNMREVYLMPEGRTKAEQLVNQDHVSRLCQKFGFKFTPRLHVLKFDNQRGV